MSTSSNRLKKFRSPIKKYCSPNFQTAPTHFSPSPSGKDFEKIAQTKPSNERCLYIDPDNNKRCDSCIGINPKYCPLHTNLIENLFVAPSTIPKAGNGLFAGPLGFKKNNIIGEYSQKCSEVKSGELDNRNGKGKKSNYMYVLIDEKRRGQKEEDVLCWDNLDKNSSIARNANDAHNSKFKNNSYFYTRREKDGKPHVYIVASRNIAPLKEIFCDYGPDYF